MSKQQNYWLKTTLILCIFLICLFSVVLVVRHTIKYYKQQSSVAGISSTNIQTQTDATYLGLANISSQVDLKNTTNFSTELLNQTGFDSNVIYHSVYTDKSIYLFKLLGEDLSIQQKISGGVEFIDFLADQASVYSYVDTLNEQTKLVGRVGNNLFDFGSLPLEEDFLSIDYNSVNSSIYVLTYNAESQIYSVWNAVENKSVPIQLYSSRNISLKSLLGFSSENVYFEDSKKMCHVLEFSSMSLNLFDCNKIADNNKGEKFIFADGEIIYINSTQNIRLQGVGNTFVRAIVNNSNLYFIEKFNIDILGQTFGEDSVLIEQDEEPTQLYKIYKSPISTQSKSKSNIFLLPKTETITNVECVASMCAILTSNLNLYKLGEFVDIDSTYSNLLPIDMQSRLQESEVIYKIEFVTQNISF